MFGKAVKRMISSLTAAAVLLFLGALPASAEPADSSAASYFCKGGELDSFVYMKDAEAASGTTASLIVNNSVTVSDEHMTAVRGSKIPVRYMLLVDLSTSMPDFGTQITAFADKLAAAGKSKVRFDVAGFGERFEIIKENVGAEDLHGVMNSLSYSHYATDIGGGVSAAAAHIAGSKRKSGEIAEIVVITDGVPYIGVGGDEGGAVKKTAASARELLSAMPELIVHTVKVGSETPDKGTMEALAAGRGLSLTMTSVGEAESRAAEISEYTDSLYRLKLPLDWKEGQARMQAQIMLTFPNEERKLLSLAEIRDVDKPETIKIESPVEKPAEGFIPEGSTKPDEPAEITITEKPAETEPPDDTKPPATVPPGEESSSIPEGSSGEDTSSVETEGSSDNGASEAVASESSPEQSESIAVSSAAEPNGESGSGIPIVPIVCAAAAVIAVAAVIVIVARKKPGKAAEDSGGIFIRAEIVSGECLSKKREFRLNGFLTIGSASDCDIILTEDDASPLNTRIYFYDNMITIEDMNRESNTSISGMRIHAPNRLRSGDEVTVGSVRMIFRF